MFVAGGIITLVFAILERTQALALATCKWDPLKLPPVPVQEQKQKRSRMHTFCQLAFAVFGLVWLMLLPQNPWLILGPAAAFLKAAPGMHVFYIPIVVLGIIALLKPAITLARPQWTWFPPVSELVQALLSLIIINFMLNVSGQMANGEWHPFLVVADAVKNSMQYIKVAAIVNVSILVTLVCAWLGLSIALLVHIWRLLSYMRKRFFGPRQPASLQAQ
jgi:hypothetical protein